MIQLLVLLSLRGSQLLALTESPKLQSGSNEASTWAATLTVKAGRHVNSKVGFSSRLYCIGVGVGQACSYPGPTLVLHPGDNLTLTLVNELGPADAPYVGMNNMRGCNITNLHTHGLHINPGVDSIFPQAGPGESLVYKYKVPSNHFPGIHWYHSHHHGASAMQIMGGLFGAIIIEPSGLENIPSSITDSDNHLIVISDMILIQETRDGAVTQGCANDTPCDPTSQAPLCTGSEQSSPFNPFRIYTYLELLATTGSNGPLPNIEILSGPEENLRFINGDYQPDLVITADSPTILRVVHASGGEEVDLSISGCSTSIVAWDGVYLGAKYSSDVISVVAGGRVDLMVTCPAGTYPLKHRGDTLMTLTAVADPEGPQKSAVSDAELSAIIKPTYMTDLTGATVDGDYAVHLSQGSRDVTTCGFWWGAGEDCSMVSPWGDEEPSASNALCPFSAFKGERGLDPATYIAAHKLVATLGDVIELKIYGLGRSKHPVHIHVNHFQVIAFNSDGSSESEGTENFYQVGQWRDTIPGFQGQLVVRFRPEDYTGEIVMHCHFLRHEDLGMMDTFLIVGSDSEDSVPASTPTASTPTASTPTVSSPPTPPPPPSLPGAGGDGTPTLDPVTVEPTSAGVRWCPQNALNIVLGVLLVLSSLLEV